MLDHKLEAFVLLPELMKNKKLYLFNNDLDPYSQILLEHAGYEAHGVKNSGGAF